MSKEEIKYEINKVLDQFSDKALEDLLSFLKELDEKSTSGSSFISPLRRILSEDSGLLSRLAK